MEVLKIKREKNYKMRIAIGITGTSGALLSNRAIELLYEKHDLCVMATENGSRAFFLESGCRLYDFLRRKPGVVKPDNSDVLRFLSSAGTDIDRLLLLPCSTPAIGKIATGSADSSLGQLASLMIQRRRLTVCVSCPTPGAITLGNLAGLASLGVTVCMLPQICGDTDTKYLDSCLQTVFSASDIN